MSTSEAEVIQFPKKPKPQPRAPEPDWQQEANYILHHMKQHPEINRMIGDRTRAFVHAMARWPTQPTPKQKAWLWGTADMVEAKLLEAEKTPPGAA